jgi:hypothetical protein
MAGLLYPVLAILLAVIAQKIVVTRRPDWNSVYAFLTTGTVAGIGLLAIAYFNLSFNVGLSAILIYAFLCELHIFIFTFAYSSISANLLVQLRRQAMDIDQIDNLYADDAMVRERIDVLQQNGFIDSSGDHIATTAKGRRFTAIFNAARQFFGHQ